MSEYTPAQIARFFARTHRVGSCLLHDATPSQRYPQVVMNGITEPANRVAWKIANGPIPDGMFVCHNCPDGDNTRCVDETHLWLGTAAQNSTDMAKKDRAASGFQNGKYTKPEYTPRGTDHYKAKLTDADVLEMRALHAAGIMGTRRLGQRFGVTQAMAWYIVARKNWKHI